MIIRSKAPLRLGLAGGGTDVAPYCDMFGGAVLCVTIDKYAYCTLHPADDGMVRFSAADYGESFEGEAAAELPLDGVLPLHKGVYNRIVEEFNEGRPLSLSMTTYSDAPAGSGLGSSSTMVVAIIKAYAEWLNLPIGDYDIARLAYQIEREDCSMAGGKQDQYAATFGGFNYIEFMPDGSVVVNPLRVRNWIVNELQNSMVLYYTGVSRESARIIEDQRTSTSDSQGGAIKALHHIKLLARTMKEAVLKGDFETVVACLDAGWCNKKATSSAVSNDLIEQTLGIVRSNGGKAAKISGAGGGGYMVIICDPECRPGLMRSLADLPGHASGVAFTKRGTQAWTLYE